MPKKSNAVSEESSVTQQEPPAILTESNIELNDLVKTQQTLAAVTDNLTKVTQDLKDIHNDEKMSNVAVNVILPSCLGGLGCFGLTVIGFDLLLPSQKSAASPNDFKVGKHEISADVVSALFIVFLGTLIGSLGILTLTGIPTKKCKAEAWKTGILHGLLFPFALSALLQNNFLNDDDKTEQTLRRENHILLEYNKQLTRQLKATQPVLENPPSYEPQKVLVQQNNDILSESDEWFTMDSDNMSEGHKKGK